jgi:hypothetical protein
MTWPQRRVGPGNDGNRSEAQSRTARAAHSTPIADPVDNLLTRLDRVRKTGRGWTAKCPAHEDRTASLSVTAGDDGRVLLHCFAGCSATDVVTSAGLSIGELFVRRPTSEMTFAERASLREQGRQAQWKAALNVLGFEAKIVQIVARDVRAGRTLSNEDTQRLIQACNRIDDAREVLCASPR